MNSDSPGLDVKALVTVPALIALAITIIRLVGELADGPEILFNKAPGGGGALIGIVWLVPVFGAYFGFTLARRGLAPASPGRFTGRALLGLVAANALIFVGFATTGTGAGVKISLGMAWLQQIVIALASLAGILIVRNGWPAFFRTILTYAFASRIPVAIVMLVAMIAGWGTHYEFGAPEFPEMGIFMHWLVTGLMPQMTFWIMFTVLVGSIFGGIAALLGRPKDLAQSS